MILYLFWVCITQQRYIFCVFCLLPASKHYSNALYLWFYLQSTISLASGGLGNGRYIYQPPVQNEPEWFQVTGMLGEEMHIMVTISW